MSSAFRNFILTLVLMLAVLGFAAWKLIPILEDSVLKPIFNETEVSKDSTSEPDVSSTDSEVSIPQGDVSESPQPSVEDTVFDCLFISKDEAGHVCSVIYAYASKQNNSYFVCSLPVNMCLNSSGRYVPIYDLLGSQSTDYAVKRLSALIGHDVKNYAVLKAESFARLTALKSDINVDLTYDVKFLNPDFAFIPDDQRLEEHYITLKAGKITLSESNAIGLINSQKSEDAVDYAFQQSMAASVFKQVCSDTKFTTDLVAQKKIHALFETNLSYADFSELSRLIFSYATAKQTEMTYPTSRAMESVIPDWAAAISAIEAQRG